MPDGAALLLHPQHSCCVLHKAMLRCVYMRHVPPTHIVPPPSSLYRTGPGRPRRVPAHRLCKGGWLLCDCCVCVCVCVCVVGSCLVNDLRCNHDVHCDSLFFLSFFLCPWWRAVVYRAWLRSGTASCPASRALPEAQPQAHRHLPPFHARIERTKHTLPAYSLPSALPCFSLPCSSCLPLCSSNFLAFFSSSPSLLPPPYKPLQLDRSALLHVGFQALDAFQAEHVRREW
jgi:hypothetical protein